MFFEQCSGRIFEDANRTHVLNKMLGIGLSPECSSADQKKIRLLNGISAVWIILLILFIGVELNKWLSVGTSQHGKFGNPISLLLAHGLTMGLVSAIFLLQYWHKYVAARLLFLASLLFMTCLFCLVLNPGKQIEVFFMFLAPVSVVFFEDRLVHFAALIVALTAFFTVGYSLDPDKSMFDGLSINLALFLSIFVMVSYLKRLNMKMEKTLELQRNKAIQDATTIKDKNDALVAMQHAQNQSFINLAHEIRTPLTLIKGCKSLLQEALKPMDKPEVDGQLAVIASNTQKINQLLDDILALSKIDGHRFTLRKELVSISVLCHKLFVDFLPSFQNKGVELVYEDGTNRNELIDLDPIYIERAMSNLLSNALKYTPTDESVTIRLTTTDQQVKIAVEDTGLGIQPENLDRVFKRYFQEKNDINQSGGNGIGLAYAKTIIEQHEGTIELDSQLDIGSVFTVFLKIDQLATVQQSTQRDEGLSRQVAFDWADFAKAGGEKILLVEDHGEMRNFIKTILPEFTIIEAANGQEGLSQLEKHDIGYIITDYMMPVMDGHDFVKEVKRRSYQCPIMVLTAKSGQSDKIALLRLGVDDYLLKPFEPTELRFRIKNSWINSQRMEAFQLNLSTEEKMLKGDSLIDRLETYIEEHCAEAHFNINQLCDVFAMSQSTLYRRVKAKTGMTIKEFLIDVRLNKARKMRETEPDISTKRLALEIGLVNTTYLRRIYENRFGVLLS